MATSYSNFTFADLDSIGLEQRYQSILPNEINAIAPSAWLTESLKRNRSVPMLTEKAKSELLVVPILSELRTRNHDFFTFYSGYTFDVDSSRGLSGRSDFILSRDTRSMVIRSPLLAIVEAKNDNLEEAVPQCAAQMLAAQIFNEKHGTPLPTVYGATTNGNDWLFVRLESASVLVHTQYYTLRLLPELLGVWQHIINFYKELPPIAP